jgi:hypothetical protein
MQFVGSDGWAVGAGGVLQSADGGARWDVVHVRTRRPRLVDFVDSQRGWIVDADGLQRTVDGGAHWLRLPVVRHCFEVESLHFVSPTTGFAVARAVGGDPLTGPSALLRTTDGGRSWRRMNTPRGAQSVCFHDSRTGWLGGSYGIYATADRGHDWATLVRRPGGTAYPPLITVQCSGDGTAWALTAGPGGASSQSPHIGYHLTTTKAVALFAEQYFPHPGVKVHAQSAGSEAGPFSALPNGAAFFDWCPSCGTGAAPWLIAGQAPNSLERKGDVSDLSRVTAASFRTAAVGCVAGERALWQAHRSVLRIVCTSDGGRHWLTRYQREHGLR